MVLRPEEISESSKAIHHQSMNGPLYNAAVREVFERGNQIGFGGLGLLDFVVAIVLSERQRAKHILRVRQVSQYLAVAADALRGLEVVILFGHFFSGTDQDGL